MIMCLYVSVNDEEHQAEVERKLSEVAPFYDATAFDPFTASHSPRRCTTLEQVECELELK